MPRSRKAPEPRARNEDYTDRELLANIARVLDADGYASTTEIAKACGFFGNGRKGHTPATKIASRLVAMRRGDLLESVAPDRFSREEGPGSHDTRWRPTKIGYAVIGGKLSKTVASAVERTDAGQKILIMRQLTMSGYVDADLGVAFALRREYQHNIAKRKLVYKTHT